MADNLLSPETIEVTPRQQLIAKVRRELAHFRAQIVEDGPHKRGDRKAFKYIMCEYIYAAIKSGNGNAEVLLRTKDTLADIYRDLAYYFDDCENAEYRSFISKAIGNCENNILRKEFLRAKGWPATDE